MNVTVFLKGELLAHGAPGDVIPAMRAALPLDRSADMLAFDDETGRQIDLDLRENEGQRRPRGRPSLGVQAREITLLPRHWEWLATQRGGASATLRRLVEEARNAGRGPRDCQDAAYRFLSVMAGNLPKFEDAMRELYAGNRAGYDHLTHDWPQAIRNHGRALAWPTEANGPDKREEAR